MLSKYRDHACFSCINIFKLLMKLFEHEATGPVLKNLLSNEENFNAMKQTCVIASVVCFVFHCTRFQLRCYKLKCHVSLALIYTLDRLSNIITSVLQIILTTISNGTGPNET